MERIGHPTPGTSFEAPEPRTPSYATPSYMKPTTAASKKIVRISAITTQGRNPDNFTFIFWEKRWLCKYHSEIYWPLTWITFHLINPSPLSFILYQLWKYNHYIFVKLHPACKLEPPRLIPNKKKWTLQLVQFLYKNYGQYVLRHRCNQH